MSEFTLKELPPMTFIGMSMEMSVVDHRVSELWGKFVPRLDEIQAPAGPEFYSMSKYPAGYFKIFSPLNRFTSWAAIRVNNADHIPEGMEKVEVPGGLYASFIYHGAVNEAGSYFQNVYGVWLPEADLTPSDAGSDDRPHMAVMGEKYSNTSPDSEEEILVPVSRG